MGLGVRVGGGANSLCEGLDVGRERWDEGDAGVFGRSNWVDAAALLRLGMLQEERVCRAKFRIHYWRG